MLKKLMILISVLLLLEYTNARKGTSPKPAPPVKVKKVVTKITPAPAKVIKVQTKLIKKTTYLPPIPVITHIKTYSTIVQPHTTLNKYYNPVTMRTYHPLIAYYRLKVYNPTGYYSTVYHLKYYDGYGYNFYTGGYGYYQYSVHHTIHNGKVHPSSVGIYLIIAAVIIISICCCVCCVKKHGGV